jgi:hypothetical protein
VKFFLHREARYPLAVDILTDVHQRPPGRALPA